MDTTNFSELRTDISTKELFDDSGELYEFNFDLSTNCRCCDQELPEDKKPKIP
jgi:hypothetical protein